MTGGAWFTWLDGRVEAVDVIRVTDGRAYVAWPESVREVEGSALYPPRRPGIITVSRPESWVPVDRLSVSCSAGVGGDPAAGCDELVPFLGSQYCPRHQ